MYLPDTNIFVQAFYDLEPEASFLEKVVKKGKVVISVAVVGEFLAKSNEEETTIFKNLMAQFGVLGIDEETALIAADYRRELLRKSKRNFLIDCFLAAQAKQYNLTLVTNNKSDFLMKDIKVVFPKG